MRIGTSNGGQNALKEEENESMEEEMQQSNQKEESNKDAEEAENVGISSIKLTGTPTENSTKEQTDENIYEPEHLSRYSIN
jgi:delta-aminolevulinic acid dehydratase/porphobilinogen synthase